MGRSTIDERESVKRQGRWVTRTASWVSQAVQRNDQIYYKTIDAERHYRSVPSRALFQVLT
jgi:hypothetical protein